MLAHVSCILILHSITASSTATAEPYRQALHIAARAELSLIAAIHNELGGLVCQRPLRIQLDDALPLPHLLRMVLLLLLQLKAHHHLLRRIMMKMMMMMMICLLLSKLVLILVSRGMGGLGVDHRRSSPNEFLLRVAEAALAVRLVEGGSGGGRTRLACATTTVSFERG